MCKMVLYLLSFLNIKNFSSDSTQPIQVIIMLHFLIFNFFNFKTHISTDSTDLVVTLEIVVHFINRMRERSETDIKKNSNFWLQLIAESVEKPVVR